ncbi:MAG: hypothetical protein PHE89_01705 [Alphaproteobacteria bacterium]|nr:hypothetical protein [Alphaproteobacteria bacterium]
METILFIAGPNPCYLTNWICYAEMGIKDSLKILNEKEIAPEAAEELYTLISKNKEILIKLSKESLTTLIDKPIFEPYRTYLVEI